jgi:hypothetical protein
MLIRTLPLPLSALSALQRECHVLVQVCQRTYFRPESSLFQAPATVWECTILFHAGESLVSCRAVKFIRPG